MKAFRNQLCGSLQGGIAWTAASSVNGECDHRSSLCALQVWKRLTITRLPRSGDGKTLVSGSPTKLL